MFFFPFQLHLPVVSMCMSHKIIGNCIFVSFDDLEEIPRPSLETVVRTGRDVGDEVDPLAFTLRVGQLFN